MQKKEFGKRIKKYAFAALLVYGIILTAKQQIDVMAKRQELADLQRQCQEQILKNEQLSNMLENENEAEYVERIARDQFGYAYPDERIYVDVSGS